MMSHLSESHHKVRTKSPTGIPQCFVMWQEKSAPVIAVCISGTMEYSQWQLLVKSGHYLP